MTVRVLVADDNLDVHELVNDILHISFKDVSAVRALTADDFRVQMSTIKPAFNLILIAGGLVDEKGKGIVSILISDFPKSAAHTAVIEDFAGPLHTDAKGRPIATIYKPFSLDEFSSVIKKICAP